MIQECCYTPHIFIHGLHFFLYGPEQRPPGVPDSAPVAMRLFSGNALPISEIPSGGLFSEGEKTGFIFDMSGDEPGCSGGTVLLCF